MSLVAWTVIGLFLMGLLLVSMLVGSKTLTSVFQYLVGISATAFFAQHVSSVYAHESYKQKTEYDRQAEAQDRLLRDYENYFKPYANQAERLAGRLRQLIRLSRGEPSDWSKEYAYYSVRYGFGVVFALIDVIERETKYANIPSKGLDDIWNSITRTIGIMDRIGLHHLDLISVGAKFKESQENMKQVVFIDYEFFKENFNDFERNSPGFEKLSVWLEQADAVMLEEFCASLSDTASVIRQYAHYHIRG